MLAGEVRVGADGARAAKPGQLVADDVELAVDEVPRYVSRGGIKLANALDASGARRRAAAARSTSAPRPAASPTACSQRGAAHVVALDVAYGELELAAARRPARDRDRARATRATCTPTRCPYAPDLIVVDVSFISLRKVLPAVLACAAPRFDCAGAGQAAVRGRPRARRQRRRRARRRAAPRARCSTSPRPRRGLGAARARLRQLAAARPEGQPRDVRRARRGRARRRRTTSTARGAGGRCRERVDAARRVMTHGRPRGDARRRCSSSRELARARGAVLRARRRGDRQARARAEAVAASSSTRRATATSTSASRSAATARSCARCAPTRGTGCRCSRVNFGEVGFLATVEPRACADGLRARARRRRSRCCAARRSRSTAPAGAGLAINDVSLHRQRRRRASPSSSYAVGGEEVGSVRCDGLVVATPAGSTGYNLANGGPVMAWGVEGMVVSFIAPHSLARARSWSRPTTC